MKENERLSNYLEIELYNKDLQVRHLVEIGKANKRQIKKYENIFRTEVRLRNGKLNANKQKGIKATKELQEYYREETTTEIYNAIVKKIFGTLDFYRIDKALMHIRNNSVARPETVEKLCGLVNTINRFGYSTAKQIWIKKYSENTFRNHIKEIEKLGMNILTFDRRIDGLEIKRETIKNFTSLLNSVPENKKLKIRGIKKNNKKRYVKRVIK